MFPIRDENPHFLTPIVSYGIIAANIAAWYFWQGLGTHPAMIDSLCEMGMIPGEFLHRLPAGLEVPLGPGSFCIIGASQTWFMPLTSIFLHGGWLHLLGNMWFMWIFANNVEDSMGHFRFAVFYLVCGLAATAVQVASDPNSGVPVVGASGAIGGVMGAYIMLYPRVRVHMVLFFGFFFFRIVVPAFFMLGYWFLIQVLGGYSSIGVQVGTAFWAHIGGFAAGAVLVLFFRDPELVRRHPNYGWWRS